MPIVPIDVDLAKYAHVTIVSPIWVFALAAPMRAFCGEAAGEISARRTDRFWYITRAGSMKRSA